MATFFMIGASGCGKSAGDERVDRNEKTPRHKASGVLKGDRLALRELEAFTSTGLAVLLTLAHTGIAGEKAFSLEQGAEIRVAGDERAGDTVSNRDGLAGGSAAADVDPEVKSAGGGSDDERLENSAALGFDGEVGLESASVHGDFTGAGGEANAGHGGLATAGAKIFGDLSHGSGKFGRWSSRRKITRYTRCRRVAEQRGGGFHPCTP